MQTNYTELAQDLRDCYDRLKDVLGDLQPLIRQLEPIDRDRAKAYWLPSLLTAVDDESDYLGGCPETLLSVVEKYEVRAEGEEVEDDEEEPGEE